jgi:hypothetical protein
MAVTFTMLPKRKINPDGSTIGFPPKPTPVTIGIPIDQLHAEVIPLAQKGIPIEKVQSAVEKDERITDKPAAMKIIAAVYTIMASKKTAKGV